MTTRKAEQAERAEQAGKPVEHWLNEASLVGRVSAEPEERELPSGDVIVTFRVVVPREAAPVARRQGGAEPPRRRQSVDALDCVAWTGRMRRTSLTWKVGDVVEVRGAMRRRFYRAGATTTSRVEIEVSGGRRRGRRTSG